MSAAAPTATFKVWSECSDGVCLPAPAFRKKKNSPQSLIIDLYVWNLSISIHHFVVHHCVHNEQSYLRYEIQVAVYTAFEDIGAVEN